MQRFVFYKCKKQLVIFISFFHSAKEQQMKSKATSMRNKKKIDDDEVFQGENQWQNNYFFGLSQNEYHQKQSLQINNINHQLNPDFQDKTLGSINEQMILYEQQKELPNRFAPKLLQPASERINPLNSMNQFPPHKQPFQKVEGYKDLRQIIESQKEKYGRKDLKYSLRHYKRDSWQNIAVYCVNCKNKHTSTIGVKKMTLVKSHNTDGKFVLKYFDNKHNHSGLLQKNSESMRNKIKTIKDEFHHASKSMTIAAFSQLMQKKYNVSYKLVRHSLYLYKKQNQNFTQVLDLIQKCNAKCWFKNQAEDYQFKSDPNIQMYDEQPEIFMIVYNEMYARFRQVGNVCYFALLNFKLKKDIQSDNQDKYWDIFTMTGLTLNYMMQPFAISYIEQNKKIPEIIASIMAKLFQIFVNVPSVLITPNQPIFDAAITILYKTNVFKGLHIYDPIWQIDRIGTDLDRYEDLSLFKNIIFSRTYSDYIKNIQKLMEMCQPTPKIRRNLSKIMKNSHKICFGCIKTYEHIGTIFDYSGNKLIYDAIKQYLFRFIYKAHQATNQINSMKYAHIDSKKSTGPIRSKYYMDNSKLNFSRITFTRCAKALMLFMRKSIVPVNCSSNYDIKPYEQIVQIPQIRKIRKCIKSNTLNAFGQQYGRIYNLVYFQRKVMSQQPDSLRVFDIYDKTTKSLFIVAPYPQYQKDGSLEKLIWRCDCLFSFKSGIPCAHEILACMITKSSLFQLFKKQYTVFQKYKKVGRPKSTRRNTQK